MWCSEALGGIIREGSHQSPTQRPRGLQAAAQGTVRPGEGGGQAWALCPKSLFGRPSLPWLQACLAHDCHKTLSIEGGGLLAAPSSLFILFIASLIGFCLCFPLPADCDSYCKASKGKLKINMKKYCKKDYGE